MERRSTATRRHRGLTAGLVGMLVGALGVVLAAPAQASGSAQAAPLDACTLVPEAELEPVLGYSLEPGDEIVSNTRASGCGYAASDPATGPDVGVLLSANAGGAKKLFSVKTLEKGFGKSKRVEDIGTRAYFSFKRGRLPRAALLVVDGKKGVEVTLQGRITRADALAKSQAVTTLALTKLP